MKKKKLSDYEVSKEFNQTKNEITPDKIYSQSRKKYWWICEKGHEWEANCNTRIGKSANCPYCTNQKVYIDNCLATLFPEVAKEWHPTKNEKTPHDVIAGSIKKYWWICNKGHEWEASIVKRTYGTGCPFCTGRKICKDNCLATLFPEVAKEWHPTKNEKTPHDVIAGSATKYWWMCNKGHEWKTSCVKRTRENRGCHTCKESHGEKAVRIYLENNKIKFESQKRFDSCRKVIPLVFDFVIYINEKIYCIEYQGEQHYKQVKFFKDKNELVVARDNIKKNWCLENNIELLEISYLDYNNINAILNDFFEKLNS